MIKLKDSNGEIKNFTYNGNSDVECENFCDFFIKNCTNDVMNSEIEEIFCNVCYWALGTYLDCNGDMTLRDCITDQMDSFIYYEDQWEIMKFFQTPLNANLCNAYADFEDYCLKACEKFLEKAR